MTCLIMQPEVKTDVFETCINWPAQHPNYSEGAENMNLPKKKEIIIL